MNVKVVSVDDVEPAAYNPREVVDDRLAMIRLSLSKLGFVLPLYASPAGELLSGHQRQTAARQLGATRVPVEACRALDLAERKVANVVFNRATNDMGAKDTPSRLALAAQRDEVLGLAELLEDIDPNSPEFMPVLRAERHPVKPLLDANRDRPWPRQALAISGTLKRTAGVVMPVVADEDGRVLNGMGRLRWAAQEGESHVHVVTVSREQGDFAEAMLNLVSMEFDLHRRYADLLRHNSFRRSWTTRTALGQGFIFAVHKGPSKEFDLANQEHRGAWLKAHGRSVVDFGAGHLHETTMLRKIGVHVAAFEPYRNVPGGIDKAASVELAREFLADVSSGRQYTSIFCSSVLNSVPFLADRQHIMVILAALAGPQTRTYLCARNTGSPGWRQVNGAEYLTKWNANRLCFQLDYEPGILVGEVGTAPKIQKFHTTDELRDLAATAFSRVVAGRLAQNAVAVAAGPRTDVLDERLAAALRFEFDLPYPDDTRMGLADEALAAFSARLGKTIE